MANCGECDYQVIELTSDTDSVVEVNHTDENNAPTDCTGWTISSQITSLGRVVGTVDISFVDPATGHAQLVFDQTAISLIQDTTSPLLNIKWVTASGNLETTKVYLEVGC